MTISELRDTGIAAVGPMPWGAHFCHFYETTEDLLETLAPYFKAGLESDELCAWMICDPVREADAWAALERVVPKLDHYRATGCIEILRADDWYVPEGETKFLRLIDRWNDKLATALARGHAGMRVTGDTLWLPQHLWGDFDEYEQALNRSIVDLSMIALCSYSLGTCQGSQVLDVARSHQLATAKRRGKWDVVETPTLKHTKAAIKKFNDELEARVEDRTRQLAQANQDLREEIAGRERAEAAEVRIERQFRALFDNATIGIGLFDPSGRLYELNRSLERMTGYSAAELASMSAEQIIEKLVHPHDALAVRTRFSALLAGAREHFTTEIRYSRKDGRLWWGNVTCSQVRDDRGQALFGIVTLEDVTERKVAEDALRKAEMELAHSNRVMIIGEMAASIAHEVNQPLTAILTNGNACLRWLERVEPNVDEATRTIGRIIADSTRAGAVIQRVRTLVSRAEPVRASLDVNDVIRDVIALAQSAVREHDVMLRTDLGEHVAPVLGDRVQLQQVLLNLITNAMEATSAAAARPDPPSEVVIASRRSDPSTILVEVRDSGTGLDPTTIERLFDTFFTTKPGGMGMGLSICRSIIESHEGKLWASANDDAGATFQFTLPVVHADVRVP